MIDIVSVSGCCVRDELARPQPKPHRAAHVNATLPRHQVDHRMWSLRVDVCRVGVFQAEKIAGDLDHRHVQPIAQTEIRNIALARVSPRGDLALDTARSEAAWDDNA